MATLDWVVTDQSRDVAFFALTADDPNDATAFSKSFVLASTTPDVGGEIAVLGYRAETPRQANGHYSMAMLLVLRRGLVVHRHERHVYCQRECIEASIPTLSGMSGGPVFAIPANGQPIRPFGFVSHDLDDGQIQDRTKPGTLIVPVLGTEVKTLADGSEQAVISMLRDNIRRLDEGATTGGPFPPPPRLDE